MTAAAREPERPGIPASTIIVGGGLAGGLLALAKVDAGSGAGMVLIEGERLGGNHTWSFHRTDVDDRGWYLVAPLVAHRWPRHEVRFPGRTRTIDSEYATVTSERFARVVSARLAAAGVRVLLGRRAVELGGERVRLDDGSEVRGALVLDARGPEPADAATTAGYQKFVGLELDLADDGPWRLPVVMDAAEDVAQLDGFRFIYVLPFSRRHVLVEDTVYSDGADLDVAAFEARVLAHAAARGARVSRVLRRERGVLPLPVGRPANSNGRAADAGGDGPVRIGYRGGLFHPVTGYSLPLATRVALALASADTGAAATAALAAVAAELERQQRFGRLLNRLMFAAIPPAVRWTALERFYRLPEATIARFYASRTTAWDRLRLLAGRPPRGLSWRRLVASPEGRA